MHNRSNPAPQRQSALPPLFFVALTVATLGIAAGVIGLFVPDLVPALAHPPVAIACIGVGFALEGWALSMLLATLQNRKASG